uniref:Uncharacterized protein n=1 Tax=Cucumis melo TaxID=3656 RepID=A0A9I9EAR9_CUCME
MGEFQKHENENLQISKMILLNEKRSDPGVNMVQTRIEKRLELIDQKIARMKKELSKMPVIETSLSDIVKNLEIIALKEAAEPFASHNITTAISISVYEFPLTPSFSSLPPFLQIHISPRANPWHRYIYPTDLYILKMVEKKSKPCAFLGERDCGVE